MLVRYSLIPAAGIAVERAHLDRIAIYKHRRRHVVPRAHQAHHLLFERRIDQLDIP